MLLSAIAAVSERIRLAASAVIAPRRHPLLLARELPSLRGPSDGAAQRQLEPRRVRGTRCPVLPAWQAPRRAPGDLGEAGGPSP
nr:hypothetical protein [Streptomyces sp. NRRL B-3229]